MHRDRLSISGRHAPRLLFEQLDSSPSAVLAASLVLLLGFGSGCTLTPTSPGVLVMPNRAESFDRFKSDDAVCRDYAEQSVNGYTPNNGMAASGVLSTLAAGALGAIAGGAWGGAVMGAGTGAALGGLYGLPNTRESRQIVQQRYDQGYLQCMVAHGHQVPVYGFSYYAGMGGLWPVPVPNVPQ